MKEENNKEKLVKEAFDSALEIKKFVLDKI